MTTVDGFVIIDKPSGITSHDVVAQLRIRGARYGSVPPMGWWVSR